MVYRYFLDDPSEASVVTPAVPARRAFPSGNWRGFPCRGRHDRSGGPYRGGGHADPTASDWDPGKTRRGWRGQRPPTPNLADIRRKYHTAVEEEKDGRKKA